MGFVHFQFHFFSLRPLFAHSLLTINDSRLKINMFCNIFFVWFWISGDDLVTKAMFQPFPQLSISFGWWMNARREEVDDDHRRQNENNNFIKMHFSFKIMAKTLTIMMISVGMSKNIQLVAHLSRSSIVADRIQSTGSKNVKWEISHKRSFKTSRFNSHSSVAISTLSRRSPVEIMVIPVCHVYHIDHFEWWIDSLLFSFLPFVNDAHFCRRFFVHLRYLF